jgi:hypothetical protein
MDGPQDRRARFAWVAEVPGFCRSVPGCADRKPFIFNSLNTWLETGSQDFMGSIPVSSTNRSNNLRLSASPRFHPLALPPTSVATPP